MPEDGEVRASGKLLQQGIGWQIVSVTKTRHSKWCLAAIDKMNSNLPLTIYDIQTKGKELALIFSNQCALLFNLGTGASFYVGGTNEKSSSPLDYRTNLSLICANGTSIYVVDCHNTQNQVRLHWREQTEPIWTVGRGPDLLDIDETLLIKHIQSFVQDDKYKLYFERATLIECLLNQSLFNGIGAYVSSETCYWLLELKGIRPWINFGLFCQSNDNLRQLVRIVRTYLRFMEKYISIHGSDVTCIKYNEWKWQNFRAVFLRVYRQASVIKSGQRVKIQKFSFGLTKSGSHGMKITRSKAQCFTPQLQDDEQPPANWVEKRVNLIGRNSLGVGWFSWFGAVDRKITLNSAQKDAIQLRPPTKDLLLGTSDATESQFDDDIDDDVENEEDCEMIAEDQTLSTDSGIESKKKRDSQRKRVVSRLNKEMLECITQK